MQPFLCKRFFLSFFFLLSSQWELGSFRFYCCPEKKDLLAAFYVFQHALPQGCATEHIYIPLLKRSCKVCQALKHFLMSRCHGIHSSVRLQRHGNRLLTAYFRGHRPDKKRNGGVCHSSCTHRLRFVIARSCPSPCCSPRQVLSAAGKSYRDVISEAPQRCGSSLSLFAKLMERTQELTKFGYYDESLYWNNS